MMMNEERVLETERKKKKKKSDFSFIRARKSAENQRPPPRCPVSHQQIRMMLKQFLLYVSRVRNTGKIVTSKT